MTQNERTFKATLMMSSLHSDIARNIQSYETLTYKGLKEIKQNSIHVTDVSGSNLQKPLGDLMFINVADYNLLQIDEEHRRDVILLDENALGTQNLKEWK